ncbi:lipopolysaccharide biosynthesis protein [Flavobacterium sp. JP2137]|uniref:lipopolysaccharide biosynthesis protein n=1 Tax=Flavobacterium sp. JP2137 TaxID=3414510 RepID=UPI003D2FDA97
MGKKISTKQAILFTVINYAGVLIGVVSTVLIYPRNKELLGIIRYVEACTQIMFPILVLGSTHALINFYPNLNAKLQQKLFGFSLLSIFKLAVAGFLVLLLSTNFSWTPSMDYIWMGFVLAIFMAYIELFRRQATNLQKLAVPTLYEKIIPKVVLPALFLLVLFQQIERDSALWMYVFSFGVIAALVGFYVYKKFPFKIYSQFDDLFAQIDKRQYYSYSLYAFAGSFGSFFAFRVDSLMIPEFISFEANGTYNIAVTLASALSIPAMGVFALYAPVISDFIKREQWQALNQKYKEVSKTLFFIGALLYSCIVVGIEPLFKMMPTYDNLAPSIPVILLLGVNVVINMSTGFNTEIISYSKYYRFNLVSILSLMVLNVALNVLLLTQTDLGIIGVAYASLFSLTLFNAAKTYYIYKKMQLLPFDWNFFKMAALFGSSLLVVYSLPLSGIHGIDFALRVFLILTVNTAVLYLSPWCPPVKYWIRHFMAKYF